MTDPEAPQNHIPSLEVVTAAYADVLAHNDKHTGIGAGFGNLLTAMMEAEDDNQDDSDEDIYATVGEKISRITTESDMQGELQGILHEDTFTRIGLRLAPLGNHLVSDSGESAASAELLPMLANTELYIDFLSQLDAEEVQADDSNFALMADVVTTLQKTIAICYKTSEDMPVDEQVIRQYGEDALRSFLQIDEAYIRLGLDKPASYEQYVAQGAGGNVLADQWRSYNKATRYLVAYEALQEYVTYWGRGVLPEYLQIGSAEYLAEDKLPYFDGMHDRLIEKTDEIVTLTHTDRTREFGIEAAQAMLAGIEKTAQMMEVEPEEWFVSERNKVLLADLTTKLQGAVNI